MARPACKKDTLRPTTTERRKTRTRNLPKPRRHPLPAPRRRPPPRRRPRRQTRQSPPRYLPAHQGSRQTMAQPRPLRPDSQPRPEEPRSVRNVKLHHHLPLPTPDLDRRSPDRPLSLPANLKRRPYHPRRHQHRPRRCPSMAQRPRHASPLPPCQRPVP